MKGSDEVRILLFDVRTSKGYTLRRLEEESGISRTTINNIENGKVSPTFDQMEKLAIVLGEKIENLYDSDYK